MKSIPFLSALLLLVVLTSCHLKTAPEINGVSDSVEQSEVTLGGVLAENIYRLSSENPETLEIKIGKNVSVQAIKERFYQIKQSGNEEPPADFISMWREIQYAVLLNFEQIGENDLMSWARLNSELLRYFGLVCFADELERLFYNSQYAGMMNDSTIKSTCYTRRYDRIYVNLYTNSTLDFVHTTGGNVRLIQDTDYPNDGSISLRFEADDKRYVDLFIRIPEWAQFASVTGKGVKYPVHPGEYTEIATKWKSGDRVEIVLGMKPEVIQGGNDRFGFGFGPLFMTYEADTLSEDIATVEDPLTKLQLVSPPGKMPTFTYSGIPDHTLVLQPFYAEANSGSRTRWIRNYR